MNPIILLKTVEEHRKLFELVYNAEYISWFHSEDDEEDGNRMDVYDAFEDWLGLISLNGHILNPVVSFTNNKHLISYKSMKVSNQYLIYTPVNSIGHFMLMLERNRKNKKIGQL